MHDYTLDNILVALDAIQHGIESGAADRPEGIDVRWTDNQGRSWTLAVEGDKA